MHNGLIPAGANGRSGQVPGRITRVDTIVTGVEFKRGYFDKLYSRPFDYAWADARPNGHKELYERGRMFAACGGRLTGDITRDVLAYVTLRKAGDIR